MPKGSCMGPLLFNIFTSTITECLLTRQSLGTYADDHFVLDSFNPVEPNSESRCIERLESTLLRIRDWMSFNTLKMNPNKAELTCFASRQMLSKISVNSINVAGESVETSEHIKYLGVWMDKTHVQQNWKVAIYNIKCISSIRKYIDLDTSKLLSSSLVLTHLGTTQTVSYVAFLTAP